MHLALEAQIILEESGIMTRVVSMPCWEFFEMQPQVYRDLVLPPDVTARLSIELGASLGWERWVGPLGASLAIDHFGASAPYETILEHYGFTTQFIAHVAETLLRDPNRAKGMLRELQEKYSHRPTREKANA